MPELPEVETMVRGLRKIAKGKIITEIWADEPKLVYNPSFSVFKRKIKNQLISEVSRRGKIIIFEFSPKGFLLVHPKMTGHFLFFDSSKNIIEIIEKKSIHLILKMNDGSQLAWSDQRKFSRIEYWAEKELEDIPWLEKLGEEPLSSLSFKKFNDLINGHSIRVKAWLMDQRFVVGIGNIYASEILWAAKVEPTRPINSLTVDERKKIFLALKKILKKAIIEGGTSIAEFRNINDQEGKYASRLKVYRRAGQKCPRCKELIKRKMIGNRSTYYCSGCQI